MKNNVYLIRIVFAYILVNVPREKITTKDIFKAVWGIKRKLQKNVSVKPAIKFFQNRNLKRHATSHQKSLFSCQKCGKQYSRENHLKRHQILCNGDSKINQSKNNDVVNSESNIEYVDFSNEENFDNFELSQLSMAFDSAFQVNCFLHMYGKTCLSLTPLGKLSYLYRFNSIEIGFCGQFFLSRLDRCPAFTVSCLRRFYCIFLFFNSIAFNQTLDLQ